MFDCVLPTRTARTGSALTWQGRLNLRNAAFARDPRPLDEDCSCPACTRFSRAYIRHLVNQQELLDHRGLVLTRDQLLERVWGYTFAGDTRTVDVHVRQLRRKLGEASPIVTVWGVGYKVTPAKDAVVTA